MKLPARFSEITPEFQDSGVLYFYEHNLGNGDYFGLYWPIGKESEEPIVVFLMHDCGRIQPEFSSLDVFLNVAKQMEVHGQEQEALGNEDYHVFPLATAENDPHSPWICYSAAMELIRAEEIERAIPLLERAISRFPEYTEALIALWSCYTRVRRNEEAARTALQAVISPPWFGGIAEKPLRWLQSHRSPEFPHDPIWEARAAINFNFGGAKHNPVYDVLLSAIHEYLDRGELVRALTLMRSYGEWMETETSSFNERYQYNAAAFCQWQIEMSAKLPGGPRFVELPGLR